MRKWSPDEKTGLKGEATWHPGSLLYYDDFKGIHSGVVMLNSTSIDAVIDKLVTKVERMEAGARTTLNELAIMAGVDLDEFDEFKLEQDLHEACLHSGILLDRLNSLFVEAGCPRDACYTVRPIVNGKRGPVSLAEVEGLVYVDGSCAFADRTLALLRKESGHFSCFTKFSTKGQSIVGPFKNTCARQVSSLVKTFEECRVETWERRYWDLDVLDGGHWELQINLSDGTSILSEGSNDPPKDFEAVVDALEKLGLPEMQQKRRRHREN